MDNFSNPENQNYVNNNFPQTQDSYPAYQPALDSNLDFGPRRVSFFTLILKTFLGVAGGSIGSVILLLIFLAAASVLQPVLSPLESTIEQINPIFIFIIIAMIFGTTLVASIVTPLLLSYTERDRYLRINTSLLQIFILNVVVVLFSLPIYLSTTVGTLEFAAYAAGLQIVLVSLASALIMEIMNDQKYPLLAVYTSIIGVLIAVALNLVLYKLMSSPTVLLFAALPIIWGMIGFFQAAGAIFYYWYYTNWGNDFLANYQNYGTEYANQSAEIEEEEEAEKLPEDKSGGDFFKS